LKEIISKKRNVDEHEIIALGEESSAEGNFKINKK